MNMTAVAGPGLSRLDDEQYGNALLTEFSAEEVRRRDLSVGNHEPCGVLDIDLNWEGQAIHVLIRTWALAVGEDQASSTIA